MSRLAVSLALLITIWFGCCGSLKQGIENSKGDELTTKDPENTDEFDTKERAEINQFNDGIVRGFLKVKYVEIRREKKMLLERARQNETRIMQQAKINATGTYFFTFFQCAISRIRVTLERQYKKISTIPLDPSLENVEYPEDFTNINETHDRWMDQLPSVSKMKNRPTKQIYLAYRRWFNFLKTPLSVTHPLWDFRIDILSKLNRFRLNDKTNYPDVDTVLKKLAATAARSFRILYGLHYDVEHSLYGLAEKFPRLRFSQLLFRIIKTWYFTKEDVLLLNILKSIDSKKSIIQFVEVMNPLNEVVVIPFINDEACPSEIISGSTPIPYIREEDYVYD